MHNRLFFAIISLIQSLYLFSDSLKLRPQASVSFYYPYHSIDVFNEDGSVQIVHYRKAFQISPSINFNLDSNSNLIAGISSIYSPLRQRAVYDKHPIIDQVFYPFVWNTNFFIHSFFILLQYDLVKSWNLSAQVGLSTGVMNAITRTTINNELENTSNQEFQFISENIIGFDRFKVIQRVDQLLIKIEKPIFEKYSILASFDVFLGLKRMHLLDTFSKVFSNIEELNTIYRSYIHVRTLFIGISLSKKF